MSGGYYEREGPTTWNSAKNQHLLRYIEISNVSHWESPAFEGKRKVSYKYDQFREIRKIQVWQEYFYKTFAIWHSKLETQFSGKSSINSQNNPKPPTATCDALLDQIRKPWTHSLASNLTIAAVPQKANIPIVVCQFKKCSLYKEELVSKNLTIVKQWKHNHIFTIE